MRAPLAVLVVLLALPGLPATAAGGAASAQPPSGEAPARRWPTDAALREGMAGIRAAVSGFDHYQHGHMSPEQAVLLAELIEGHVHGIIANCRLPADADAALHAILVPLLHNAALIKADPQRTDAIAPMQHALADYARQFDDPDAHATSRR